MKKKHIFRIVFAIIILLSLAFAYADNLGGGLIGGEMFYSCDKFSVLPSVISKCGEQPADDNSAGEPSPCSGRNNTAIHSCISTGMINATQEFITRPFYVNEGDLAKFTINITALKSPEKQNQPADIMFVLDVSDSMRTNNSISRARNSLIQINNYAADHDAGVGADYFHMGLSLFNHYGWVAAVMKDRSRGWFPVIGACGCTCVGCGVYKAGQELKSSRTCQDTDIVKKVMVLASDGFENTYVPYGNMVSVASNPGYVPDDTVIYTIGYGVEDPNWIYDLNRVVKNGGFYKYMPREDSLYDVFLDILDLYSVSKPSNNLQIRLEFEDKFDFVSATLDGAFFNVSSECNIVYNLSNQSITDSIVALTGAEKILDCNLGSLEDGGKKVFEVTVLAGDGTGIEDVVTNKTGNFYIKSANICGDETINLRNIKAAFNGVCGDGLIQAPNKDGIMEECGEPGV
jgi:hypothetical protein